MPVDPVLLKMALNKLAAPILSGGSDASELGKSLHYSTPFDAKIAINPSHDTRIPKSDNKPMVIGGLGTEESVNPNVDDSQANRYLRPNMHNEKQHDKSYREDSAYNLPSRLFSGGLLGGVGGLAAGLPLAAYGGLSGGGAARYGGMGLGAGLGAGLGGALGSYGGTPGTIAGGLAGALGGGYLGNRLGGMISGPSKKKKPLPPQEDKIASYCTPGSFASHLGKLAAEVAVKKKKTNYWPWVGLGGLGAVGGGYLLHRLMQNRNDPGTPPARLPDIDSAANLPESQGPPAPAQIKYKDLAQGVKNIAPNVQNWLNAVRWSLKPSPAPAIDPDPSTNVHPHGGRIAAHIGAPWIGDELDYAQYVPMGINPPEDRSSMFSNTVSGSLGDPDTAKGGFGNRAHFLPPDGYR